jgi:hypothetical protein
MKKPARKEYVRRAARAGGRELKPALKFALKRKLPASALRRPEKTQYFRAVRRALASALAKRPYI